MLTGSQLQAKIDNVQAIIDTKDASAMAALDEDLALTFEEYVKYQDLKSRAHLHGILELDAAQMIYVAFGGEVGDPDNGNWGSSCKLATKVVVTQLMGELLTLSLAGRF
jgi:hypothetical protein